MHTIREKENSIFCNSKYEDQIFLSSQSLDKSEMSGSVTSHNLTQKKTITNTGILSQTRLKHFSQLVLVNALSVEITKGP